MRWITGPTCLAWEWRFTTWWQGGCLSMGTAPTETMDRILHAEPEAMARFNHHIPAELEQIIRKCLEKDQSLRYQHASDLCADLKRLKRDTDSGKVGARSGGNFETEAKGEMARPGVSALAWR